MSGDKEKLQDDMRQVNSRLEALLQEKSSSQTDRKKKNSREQNFAACLRELPVLPRQREVEIIYIHEVMRRVGGSQVRAAEIMGITPQALCSRLKRHKEKQ